MKCRWLWSAPSPVTAQETAVVKCLLNKSDLLDPLILKKKLDLNLNPYFVIQMIENCKQLISSAIFSGF